MRALFLGREVAALNLLDTLVQGRGQLLDVLNLPVLGNTFLILLAESFSLARFVFFNRDDAVAQLLDAAVALKQRASKILLPRLKDKQHGVRKGGNRGHRAPRNRINSYPRFVVAYDRGGLHHLVSHSALAATAAVMALPP